MKFYLTMTQGDSKRVTGWHVAAAVAAWLWPGLGHAVLGEHRRAVILAASIGLLWLTGLAIGGIGVCDRQEHLAWFAGQAMIAPTWIVDFVHQRLKPTDQRPGPADQSPAFEPSYGHENEMGILYTALAGLLNLLAVLDVIHRNPNRIRANAAATSGLGSFGGSP